MLCIYEPKQLEQIKKCQAKKVVRGKYVSVKNSDQKNFIRFRSLGDGYREKELESRLSEIAELKKHIFNYSKTKDIYAEYKKHGYSKKFFEEYREEIILHKAAKEAFSKMGGPAPIIKDLNEEFGKLLQEKKQNYAEYRKARKEMRDFQTAKYNVERFYQTTGDKEKEKGKKRSSTVL